jgi:hypothetical protein
VRWIRTGIVSLGALAMLGGLAMFELECVPASATGWMLLPLAGAALLLVGALAEFGLARTRGVLTTKGAVLLGMIVALLAIGLALAWTHFA